MSQVGRISGPLLTSNLERNGINLAFRNTSSDTQLLYLDVNTNKIGINKGVAGYDVDIAGTARSTNLITDTSTIANYTIENNNLNMLVGDIYLNASEAVVFANIENGTIRISDNVISTTLSNADIDLAPLTGIGDLLHTLDNPNAYGTSQSDYFGRQVAIDGNSAIAGAYREDDAGNFDSGKAYIFNVTSGALVHTLDNPTAYGTGSGDYFGQSVAISGNSAIIGAYREDDAGGSLSGKAYIFNVTSGALVHTLDNPTAYSISQYDYFGQSVAISGNSAIVGAYGEDDADGTDSGKAYIFNVTTGALVHTLDNPNAYDTSENDRFGWSVAISGNSAIVGAYTEADAGGVSSGKAYIFNVTTGALVHILDNPNAYDTSENDRFGHSVAISGNSVIVGAYIEGDADGTNSGKAYIFNVTSGALVHTLDNPNAYGTSKSDWFGYSVAISGNTAIVGASFEDDAGGVWSGNTYIYNVTSGALVHTLDNPNAYNTSGGDRFGGSVAISSNLAIVSAYSEDDASGNTSGKAYIYKIENTTETNSINVFGDIHSLGNITLDGTITLGNAYLDTVDFNSSITSSIIPDQTNTYDIGTSEKRWETLYTNLLNGAAVNTSELLVGGLNIDHRNGGALYVSQNGNDTNTGDHAFSPFATISRALQAADASNAQPFVIYVTPGEYQEALPLVVPNNVSIVGEDIRNCIIVPDTGSQSEDVFHLSNNSTVANVTIKNFYYNSSANTGYAFRFAPDTIISERSPYLSSVSVITHETSEGDGDAGRGAWIDGNELNNASTLAAMLFHSCTFISPGADVINMTNGVRVEWLNSFTYFANRGLYAFTGSEGRVSEDGSTVNYGAELRAIGSANVYGNYGAVADGADTLMYLTQHNFGYIGSGNSSANNISEAIQANETVTLNGGRINYVSTDHRGNYRVGDNFYVDLETGSTNLSIDTGTIDARSGLIINTGVNTTTIFGNLINTGNINILDNNILSISGALNVSGATNVININDNTTVDGSLNIRDNLSFGGTLNISGDQTTDSIDFNVNFEQNFNPHQTLTHNLGKESERWNSIHLGRMQPGNITSDENYITTDESNSNLELRANGTGIIKLPVDLEITNDLTVVKTTTLKNSITTYEYGPELVTNGTFTSNLTGWTQSGGGSAVVLAGNLQIIATGSARNISQAIVVEPGSTYDIAAIFRSVSNSNAFYLRVFESGVGTLLEWNETTGLVSNQTLAGSFVPVGSSVSIILRAVDTIIQWDEISLIKDIGLVETITPVQINIVGNTTQTSDTSIIGSTSQTGNANIAGNLTVSNEVTAGNFNFNDNVLRNFREDLRLNSSSPYDVLSIPQIVTAMINDGATAADYAEQTEKNLVNFLANGTSAPYANSYIDVNVSGTTTSSDALAWLQYVANGTTNNAVFDAFLYPIVELLLEDEYAAPGKYNSNLFSGDYFRADFKLQASGTGRVSFPTNDVRITNNLFAASMISNNIVVNQDLDFNDIVITDNNILVDDNFISTNVSNANLELRANRNVVVPSNDIIIDQDLTVNGTLDINDSSIVGTVTQTGNRNQNGNLNVVGNVTVTSTNIASEIQFDNILFNDNYIQTANSNADLELRANGTGIVTIPTNNVTFNNDATIGSLSSSTINTASAIAAEVFELDSEIRIYDNVITTTTSNSNLELRSFNSRVNIENFSFKDTAIRTLEDINLTTAQNLIIAATGAIKIPVGTSAQATNALRSMRFNSSDNVFEATSSDRITFGGVYSANRTTSVLAHPTAATINFKVNNETIGSVTSNGMSILGLDVDDILIQDNVIKTTNSNSDLDLSTNGTGKLELYSTTVINNKLQNNNAGALSIIHTGYGVAKFNSTSSIAIPFGTDATRKTGSTEVGMTRWNTENTILETWDGNTYISAAGSAATISEADFQDLMLEYTLIFG